MIHGGWRRTVEVRLVHGPLTGRTVDLPVDQGGWPDGVVYLDPTGQLVEPGRGAKYEELGDGHPFYYYCPV